MLTRDEMQLPACFSASQPQPPFPCYLHPKNIKDHKDANITKKALEAALRKEAALAGLGNNLQK